VAGFDENELNIGRNKMKRMNLIVALLASLLSATLCYSNTVYQEIFSNTNSTDLGISSIGWHANTNSMGDAVDENNGSWNTGVPVSSVADYLFYSLAGGSLLNWTDESPLGDISTVTDMRAIIRNSSASEDLKFAIKVDGAWYVSQEVFNSSANANAEIRLEVQSALWNSLTLIPGTTMAEGGTTVLPSSGSVQGVGFFDAVNENRVRVVEFAIQSIPGIPFNEDFLNLGPEASISTIGWHVNHGATAVAADETNSNGALGPVSATGDYLYYNLGAAYSNAPVLSWTEAALGSINNITNIAVTLRNENVEEDLKFAVKVSGSWYVSTNVFNNPAANQNGTVSLDLQSFSWNSLSFVSGSVLAEGGAVARPSGLVEAIGLFDASDTTDQRVRLIQLSITGVTSSFAGWMGTFNLSGADAEEDCDYDGDGMVNLVEYALGGNPTVADSAALLPFFAGSIESGGTNWMEYVYRRRLDADLRRLSYEVVRSTDLVTGSWTSSGIVDGGSGPIDGEFESVTNLISTAVESAQFIKLNTGTE
jgi:hypothetical protein